MRTRYLPLKGQCHEIFGQFLCLKRFNLVPMGPYEQAKTVSRNFSSLRRYYRDTVLLKGPSREPFLHLFCSKYSTGPLYQQAKSVFLFLFLFSQRYLISAQAISYFKMTQLRFLSMSAYPCSLQIQIKALHVITVQ